MIRHDGHICGFRRQLEAEHCFGIPLALGQDALAYELSALRW